ncbi:MAG: hypothetical protein APF81_01145 [Desulfosporosinus sp. BRH_c37]|nr:MAG: hypothetical protein APF81_01145 [Desulfosporosinus sp. BRH_c37]
MIKSIEIKNFKCFKNNEVNLNKASLLLGTNSGGKSSLIQAILLAEMSLDSIAKYNAKSLDLITNKYGLNLYFFDEILYQDAEENVISIDLHCEELNSKIEYIQTDDNNVVAIQVIGDKRAIPLLYLSADRSISKYQKSGDINNLKLGDYNEYLGYILEKGRQKNVIIIDMERNHWKYSDTTVLDIQVNNWLNFVLPNNRVTAKNTGSDNYVSLLFGDKATLHQTNVGYGVSFVLPIIVAGLIADKNSILVIENPELHLHPKAQSNLASFLAVVAASGVQVIIETHSEHVVNGFRKAVLNENNPLKSSDLSINYFEVNEVCHIQKVELNEKAEITHWPCGFLDQEENDLFELRKMRLKK